MMTAVPRFTVDAFGWFLPGTVHVHWRESPRPTTPALEDAIGAAWEKALVDCAARGAMLYNGSLMRWLGHRVEEGHLHIDVGPTCFRDFVGTNLYNGGRVEEIGRERFANPLGTTATVITSDRWLVYGRRSQRVAWHAGYLHTFGGALEAVDRQADGTVDTFAAVRRELGEELNLESSDYESLVCVGLVHDHEIWQPELLFEARLRLTRDALLQRLGPDDPRQEHDALELVRDETEHVVPFIPASVPIAPVAVGAVCLHGRHRWGEAWYQQLLAELPFGE